MLKVQSFFEALKNDCFVNAKKVNTNIINGVDYIFLEVNSGGTSWDNGIAYNIYGYAKISDTIIPVWEPFCVKCFQKTKGCLVNDVNDETAMHNRLSTEELIQKIQAEEGKCLLIFNS